MRSYVTWNRVITYQIGEIELEYINFNKIYLYNKYKKSASALTGKNVPQRNYNFFDLFKQLN
jgi:hypothetical protein